MDAGFVVSDLLGYSAAALVLLTFLSRSMTALRVIAIVSNLMFIAYAVVATLPPVLLLHGMLLPLNAWRLWQASQRPPVLRQRQEPTFVDRAPSMASFRSGLPPRGRRPERLADDLLR
jgi:hypothetical protein